MTDPAVFGTLADGSKAFLYTLRNSAGMTATVAGYGATVVSLLVPDREGRAGDVVLGYDTLEGYLRDRSYIGSIVGRYGNRIGGASFPLDGVTVRLAANNGRNHLHGGVHGFHAKNWRAEAYGPGALNLILTSPAGEEGYPGTVTLRVMYAVTDANELVIGYEGTSDAPTILNPTHHAYFNLGGNPARTVLGHRLRIDADSFTPVDGEQITTGDVSPVAGTPMDFRAPSQIGARIDEPFVQLQYGRGYDHNWVLRGYDGTVRTAAELSDPESGRVMTLLTDQPGLQFYSGNVLDGTARGKGEIAYGPRCALCLEAQHFPDSPNKPHFPPVTLRPGEVYRQTTIYRFSVR